MSDSQSAELNGGMPPEPFDYLLLLRMSAVRRRLEREHWARQAVLGRGTVAQGRTTPRTGAGACLQGARPTTRRQTGHMLGEVIAFPHRS
jgi:hypothetical protein